MQSEFKEKFLELLDKDKEFRYAVAGYLGISEILKKLDSLAEGQNKLLENQNKLWESHNKLWESVNKLWENQNRLWENQNRLWEEVKGLREDQEKLWENQNRLWEEVKRLREDQEKLWENQNKLWESHNKLWEELKGLREDQKKLWENVNKLWEEVKELRLEMKRFREEQNKISVTLERLTLSVEDEARDVISYRIKKELGVEIKLDRLFIDEREINIYGANDNICIVGEATVRLGQKLIEELEEKIYLIKKQKPDLLKPKIIKVIYADYAIPSALELASKHDIWVLNWKGDLSPRRILMA